jgi:hypothetical protein
MPVPEIVVPFRQILLPGCAERWQAPPSALHRSSHYGLLFWRALIPACCCLENCVSSSSLGVFGSACRHRLPLLHHSPSRYRIVAVPSVPSAYLLARRPVVAAPPVPDR